MGKQKGSKIKGFISDSREARGGWGERDGVGVTKTNGPVQKNKSEGVQSSYHSSYI